MPIKIVGASNRRDITRQKRIKIKSPSGFGEAEHRSQNLLATVQATINLSQSTPRLSKTAIEGLSGRLPMVHFPYVVETRWIGCGSIGHRDTELASYSETDETRVQIDGPQVLLEPNPPGHCVVPALSWLLIAAKYGALSRGQGSS